ncbi:MAG: hypothetical protein AABX23_01255 [Nanoarchaeota archaeon]
MNRKETPGYMTLKPNLREEIQSALDRVVEEDFVEDIEDGAPIISSIPFYKRPYVKVLGAVGNALAISVHSMDKFGRAIGYRAMVKCNDWRNAGYDWVKRRIETIVPQRATLHPGYT